MAERRLALLYLHQRTAPLDARERLTAAASVLQPGPDLLGLLTCHRVELYAVLPGTADLRETFAQRLGLAPSALEDAEVACGRDAAWHLFRVACGLDSAIVGEGQISRQLRRVYDAARAYGPDPLLAGLVQQALHLARTLRSGTALGEVRRSIGSLAVDEALRHVPDPALATALVIGAGEIGKLAARALAKRVGTLLIANRDGARAASVAAMVSAETVALTDLGSGLDRADVVISAADSRGAVLTEELLEARGRLRPLVVVDIAVPRSVTPRARTLPGLVYRDVDDLSVGSSVIPPEVVADAETRCADAADRFMRWVRERESSETIRAVHDRANDIRDRQLDRAMRRLGHLSERDREVVAGLATALTHALLHAPTVRLRERPEAGPLVRTLFEVDA